MMFFDRWRRSKTVGKRSRDVRCGMPAARRRLQLEPLEQRRVLSVTINPITGPDSGGVFDVSAGKDLYVPVVGSDQGLPITYNASSSDPNVQVSVLTGNPTLQFSVSGTDVNGAAFSGTMTFQLFENIAPQTVQGIINQVNAGLYDGSSFYRMETSPTFQLIQGGIEMTSGKSDTTVLPDEFNVDATFNSSGLLAMANAGLGTATSEFFVTAPNRPLADDPQALNFGYTIFGQLITGQDIYDKILNVPTTSSNGIHFANNAVTITSASIITDFQDAVLQISEPNGYTGTSTITVTGLGSDSSVGQQSFVVSVAAPATSQSSPLLLDPVINRTTSENQPVSFQISASDFYGDPPTFTVTGADSFNATPANVTVQVTPVSNGVATVTLTPANGFTGTISLVAHAEDSTASLHDAQAFRLTVSANFAVSSVTGPINSSNETNTSASGTGTVGDTISAVASDGTNSTAAHTTTVDANGNWSISGIDVSSLADGTITYTVNDTTNAASGSKTSTKDTVAPAVSITSVTNPITQANQTSASASGTGEVGATISLVASDGTNLTTAQTTTVDANGNWSISSIDLSSLADGTITFSATATDAVGNMAPDEMTATKDTAAPAVAITSVTDPITIASRTSASASGTGEVGATISLVASDGTISTTAQMTTVDSNGDWSISLIDLSSLADGTITFTATAADSAGNTGSATATATKTTIALTTVTGPVNAANVASASASGTGEAGASVSLVVSDGTNSTGAYTTTIAGDGTWSISGIDLSALADGPLTYTATATDQLENSAVVSKTASKDTVAPSITLSSVTDPVNLSDANNVSASGTGEAGATISVAVSDGTNSTTAQTTTADASGNWSISGIDVSSLADGTITFTATATDAAGNSSSTDMTAAKDTVAPAVAVTTVTNPVTLASHTSAAASGTGEVGAAISLVVGDGTHSTIPMTTTVDANGTWSVSGIDLSTLADGTITFTATATDAAGNTAQSSMTATKTTVAVTVVTNPVNSANVTSTSASGTGEVGATVSLVVSDGTNSTTPMTTTVDANGNWSISGIDRQRAGRRHDHLHRHGQRFDQQYGHRHQDGEQRHGGAGGEHHFGYQPDHVFRCRQHVGQRHRRSGRDDFAGRQRRHQQYVGPDHDGRRERHLVDQRDQRQCLGRRHDHVHRDQHRRGGQFGYHQPGVHQAGGGHGQPVGHGLCRRQRERRSRFRRVRAGRRHHHAAGRRHARQRDPVANHHHGQRRKLLVCQPSRRHVLDFRSTAGQNLGRLGDRGQSWRLGRHEPDQRRQRADSSRRQRLRLQRKRAGQRSRFPAAVPRLGALGAADVQQYRRPIRHHGAGRHVDRQVGRPSHIGRHGDLYRHLQ